MSQLSYRDKCVITRKTHEVDQYDEPIGSRQIYSGYCDFQPGGQTSLSIVTSNDVVYLPIGVLVRPNDSIRVEPRLAEPREGVVKLANVLELELTGEVVTEIEIKQSQQK